MAYKLASRLKEGDTILWDGLPATVTAAEAFTQNGIDQVEVIVSGTQGTSANVWDADCYVLMA